MPKRSSLHWVLCAARPNQSSFHVMIYIIQRDSSSNQGEITGAHPLNFLLDSAATSETLRDPSEGLRDPLHHKAFQYGPVPPILWPIKTREPPGETTEEWRMELIGPGTQEVKESWHMVIHVTLADYTGSKPCTPRPHLLSRPKKNMCFLLCSLSQYEDWYSLLKNN